ncbi:MAG: HAMP domain-containing histidine kinase [Chloroflexi bacterium]|nr:HAMP domain-containing histidine kinase [Chloroflexota bacterium]
MTSIRTRLLLAYGSILLIGFAALAIVAGRQISSSARADYERRLIGELELIARRVERDIYGPPINSFPEPFGGPGCRFNGQDRFPGRSAFSSDDLDDIIESFDDHRGGDLALFWLADEPRNGLSRWLRDHQEVDAAVGGENAIVVERRGENGQPTLYTATAIGAGGGPPLILQLSAPLATLQMLIWERWALLGAIVVLVGALSLAATVWVSRSIIQPLYALHESALRLSAGDFAHRVADIRRDEVGAVARAFNDMAQQVESMLEEQRAFASNISHELRTPLTTIRLRSEALRYDALADDLTQQYVAEIDDEVRRLGSLVEDLALLARFDAGRAELGQSEIDLRRFVGSLTQQLQPQATAKHIDMQLRLPDDLVPVHASLNHLTVVFRNLLDNALKYTPAGGQVMWAVAPGPESVCIKITDTGCGVDPAHLPHLFERFYRADKARSRDIPGSGLGLALVQSIVQAYGGQITINSPGLGRGTTVTIVWPYRPTVIAQ